MSDLDRRAFLVRSGRLLAALGLGSSLVLLPGCGSGSTQTDVAPPASTGSAVAPNPFQDLANRITGALLLPATPAYAAASRPQNRRYDTVLPAVVVVAANAADVQQTVLWARQHQMRVVAKSGGHSYGGFSTTTGVLLSLAALDGISVDTSTNVVTVGPGAMNQQIYPALAPYNLAIPAGRCPTVCAGGLVLGGGFGFTSRTLGLTSDTLVETEIVTADGQLLTCNARNNSDLYWACRGGGGGNFGINTAYKIQAQPVGVTSWYRFTWDVPTGITAMEKLEQMVDRFPNALSVRAGIGVSGAYPRTPGSAGVNLNAIGLYLGPQDEMEALLAPLVTAAPPATTIYGSGTFLQAARFTFLTTPVDYYAVKSTYAATVLPSEAIRRMVDVTQAWPGSANSDGAGVAMFLWGGQMNAVPRDATAFVHRDARWLVAMETSWEASDAPAAVDANLAWLQRLADTVAPYATSEAYQNFIDPTLATWPTAYYAENLPRLVAVKAKYDPTRFFDFPQAIPSAL